MNEMIERVARALAVSRGVDPDRPHAIGRDGVLQLMWDLYVPDAKFAVSAMREPTEGMAAAGELAARAEGAHDCEVEMSDVYRAMIDAALEDV
jgi:hypothetical protein